LPKYFGTLHADTRTALKAAFENDEIPDAGEHLGELRKVKLVYEAKKAWDDAAAILAETEYLAGGIADGELVVLFMSIGNGDCIFVRTPDGNVIVIDCGSRKRPAKGYRERIADVLTTHFLKTAGKQDKKPELYAVILTHADQDHYNELAAILDPHIEGIRHLFDSDELTAYTINPKDPDPSSGGEEEGCREQIRHGGIPAIESAFRNKVTINSTAVTLTKSGSAEAVPYVVDQDAKTIKILDEDWNGAKTEIILLAGGVAENTEVKRQVMAADTRLGRKQVSTETGSCCAVTPLISPKSSFSTIIRTQSRRRRRTGGTP